MRFGSLFAGIGGLDLGLERAGMECAWQVENNEFCQKVLNKHWPDVPKFGDIRDVGKETLEAVDLICGGFPCQPFSTAGKRKGTADDRHLWPEMLRVISELKPTWVIGENVPGIISIFVDQAISDLETEGYTCETFVLPACAFDAPHQRNRLFIIAYTNRNSKSIKSINGDKRQRKLGTMGNSKQPGLQRKNRIQKSTEFAEPNRWLSEPRVGRVADGVSQRVERIRGISNAVVPQVAEHIGRMILEAEKSC